MTDWSKLKVTDLKKELSSRGLIQSGLKQELVNRLTADDETKAEAQSATGLGLDASKVDHLVDASNGNDGGANEVEKVAPPNPEPDARHADGLRTEEHLPGGDSSMEKTAAISIGSSTALEGSPLVETTEERKQIPEQSHSEVPAADETSKELDVAPVRGEAMLVNPPMKGGEATVGIKEVAKDSQKRKRRSLTPDIPSDDAKRVRHDLDVAGSIESHKDEVVTTQDDVKWVEKHNGLNASTLEAEATEVVAPNQGTGSDSMVVDVVKGEQSDEDQSENRANEDVVDVVNNELMEGGGNQANENTSGSSVDHEISAGRDSRFKAGFRSPAANMDHFTAPGAMEGIETDRMISPAIHPATTALYIRNFMRPINYESLKEYLAFLATPPSSDTDPSIISEFYLDPIRSHAYVSFANISAASRVRSAVHDTVWPAETNRKPLWADFIPAEKVDEWIEQEKNTGGSSRDIKKRWEVVYEDDGSGGVIALLRETDVSNVPARQNPVPGLGPGIPTGPRHKNTFESNAYMDRRPTSNVPSYADESSILDSHFLSTTALPKLYYQPLSKELVKKRLDGMDRITRENYRPDEPAADINRYTFENGDKLVDRGPEIFDGIRPPRGGGGPSRYRGGGNYGGGGGHRRDRRRMDRYAGGGGESGRRSSGGGGYGGGAGYRNHDDGYDGYRGSGVRRY